MRKQAYYEKNKIVQDYLNDNFSVSIIAKNNNISIQTVYDILRRENIAFKRGRNNRKNKFNYHYFDIINSKDKAYFLGWLYSDGNNYPPTGTIQLGIQESDIKILKILQSYITNKRFDIKIYKRKQGKNKAVLKLTSKITSKALEKLGVVQNKTFILEFPTEKQVSKKYIHHFIRGYFDGDGCITAFLSKKDRNPSYFFTISGNHKFLNVCQDVIISILNFRKTKLIKNRSIFNMCYGGNNQIILLYNWLYTDCDDLYLERKKLKFEELCKRQ
jgi:hypothetical protein